MRLFSFSLASLFCAANFMSAAVPAAPSVAPATATAVIPSVVVPSAKNAVDAGVDTVTKNKAFNLGLKWNESAKHFSVAVPNAANTDVTVIGVQASSGLYVTNIPQKIPANGTASVNAFWVATSGSSEQMSILRVLTSGGEIVVQVNHTREQVAQFSATTLKWTVGATANAQTINLTVAPNTSVPIGVQAMGAHTAKLTALGGGNYTITVTPASTAKETHFPVVVIFQPQLPGASAVISCDVLP